MREVLEQFREWHANHFGDFSPEINAELLCIDNAAEAALQSFVPAADIDPCVKYESSRDNDFCYWCGEPQSKHRY